MRRPLIQVVKHYLSHSNRCEAVGNELYCTACGDNTQGQYCQECVKGFYPNGNKFIKEAEYCRPCQKSALIRNNKTLALLIR